MIDEYTHPFMVWFTSRITLSHDELRRLWNRYGCVPVPGRQFYMQPDAAWLQYFEAETGIDTPVLSPGILAHGTVT